MLKKLSNVKDYSRKGYKLRKKYVREIENTANDFFNNQENIEEIVEFHIHEGRKYGFINNSCGAAVCGITVAATTLFKTKDNETLQLVLVDEMYNMLSENGKRFVLLHEIGHFENKDFEDGNMTRDFKKEVKADKYALNFMTIEEILSAMKEMAELLKYAVPSACDNTEILSEVEARIVEMKKEM